MNKLGRQLLAASLEKLRILPNGDVQSEAAFAAKVGVDQTSINRALNEKSSIGVDIVTAIARAYGCEPWQLLVPGFDPKRKPELAGRGNINPRLSKLGVDLALAYDSCTARMTEDEQYEVFKTLEPIVLAGRALTTTPGVAPPDGKSTGAPSRGRRKLRGQSQPGP